MLTFPWVRHPLSGQKYAQVCDLFGGGMENTSATTMTDRIVLDDCVLSSTARRRAWSLTSWPINGKTSVTCPGLVARLAQRGSSYAEALWDEESSWRRRVHLRHVSEGWCSRRQAAAGHGSSLHTQGHVGIAHLYPKGAWVLHVSVASRRRRLWKGIQRYGTEYALRSIKFNEFPGRSMQRITRNTIWTLLL